MRIVPERIASVLKNKNFRYFILGQIGLVCAFWMQVIASSWLIYRLTGSSLYLGTISLLACLPSLLLTPITGIIVDKFPKKKIIYGAQCTLILASFTIGMLIITDLIQIWHIMINAVVLGIIMGIESPARNAFMIDLIGLEDLQNGIALNSSVNSLGKLVGPALGGALIPFTGEGLIYLSTSLTSCILLYCLTKIATSGRPEAEDSTKEKQSLRAGFIFAYEEKAIRYALLCLGIGAIFCAPVNILLPVIAVEDLLGSSGLLGILMTIMGIGSFISAILLASSRSNKGIVRWFLASCILICCGLFLLTFFSKQLIIAILALLCIGCGTTVQIASLNTIIQLISPNKYRGRIMALYNMMILGMGVFGALFSGTSGEYLGTKFTLLISSCCFSILTLLCIIPMMRDIKLKTSV